MREPALVSEMSSSSSSSEVSARDMPPHATWVAPHAHVARARSARFCLNGETGRHCTYIGILGCATHADADDASWAAAAQRVGVVSRCQARGAGGKAQAPAPHVAQSALGRWTPAVHANFVMRTPLRNYRTQDRSDACDASHFSFASWRPRRDYRRHLPSWRGSSSFFCRASVPSVDANSGSQPRSG